MTNNVSELSWDESLKKIDATGCKELHTALKSMNLSAKQQKALRFYQISYNYGDEIATGGSLDPNTIHASNKNAVLQALNYAPIPLGLALDKNVEVNSVIANGNREEYIPTTLIRKGELFGVFEALNRIVSIEPTGGNLGKSNWWNVTAGSRAVVVNYPTTSFKSSKTAADWTAVRDIAKSQSIPWKCEVLFFPAGLVQNDKAVETLTKYLFRFGWKQNQLVLTYNSILDNALDELAKSCEENARFKFSSHILFWLFVRLFLVVSNVRPGYVLVTLNSADACGPFPGILKHLQNSSGETKKRRGKVSWTPMIFEPCFLGDSPSGVYCSAYQATVVGGLSGKVKRNVNTGVTTPIQNIRGNLERSLGSTSGAWLSKQRFIPLELKTRGVKTHVYTGDHGIDPLTIIANPYDEPFAKVLISLRKRC